MRLLERSKIRANRCKVQNEFPFLKTVNFTVINNNHLYLHMKQLRHLMSLSNVRLRKISKPMGSKIIVLT